MRSLKALFLITLACGMLAGCDKPVRLVSGGSVRFQSGSGPMETRTAYSGVTGIEGDVKKERIDWVENDRITIWSDKAVYPGDASRKTCDYSVKDIVTSGVRSSAGLFPVAQGFQWGNESSGTVYSFYARYPADQTGIDGTSMSGEIPGVQSVTWGAAGTADEFVGKPSMANAYMFAQATAEVNAESVTLEFYPKFTAFQFTVGCGENPEVTLTSFKLKSASKPLAGAFLVACSTGAVSSSSTTKDVSVSLNKTLSGDQTLTFTVFALAKETLDGLTIEFEGTPIGLRKLVLNDKNGQLVQFAAGSKHIISGISFPRYKTAEGEDILWDQEVYGEGIVWDN